MFFKLAVRNVRRSFRDYGVYLLTLTFGVCLFYTFNSIDGQSAMIYLSQSQNPMVNSIFALVDIFSVFVAVVLACLILYADRFLLRRRKRELGTYLLLGLTQGQVSRLLVLETGAIALASLAAGLGLGVLASFGLSALTLSMFSLDASMLALSFSPAAALKTVGYFAAIFLLVMLFSGLQVSRAKLIDLLHAERKNEELKPRPLRTAVIQLVVGVVCLLAAYALLLIFGMAIAVAIPFICFPMLGLGTLGTLLIFKSLSGFVLRFVRNRPKLYYKDLNLFTLRQWISKVHTTYLSQTVICLLLLLAIGVTASSMGMNSTIEQLTGQQAPYDATIQNLSGDTHPVNFDEELVKNGFDRAAIAGEVTATVYYNDPAVTGVDENTANAVFSLSDYNRLLKLQGEKPVELAAGEVLELEDWGVGLANGSLGLNAVVAADDLAARLETRRQLWAANFASGNKQQTENDLRQAVEPMWNTLNLRFETRLGIYSEVMGSKVLVLFLGLYLGFTFLLAAAAVLALQQLSQAADNAGRYRVLRRLGAQESQMARSATQQVALAFLLPLGLAIIHSLVGMKAANDLIAIAGRVDSVGSSLITAGLLLVVYGGYFLATALACRRMAVRDDGGRR